MNNNLNIAIIQTDIVWESSTESLAKLNDKIIELDPSVELMILPEMFATGFTINVKKVKQAMDGEIVSWIKKTAIEKKVAIYGSVVIEDNHNFYNRAIFAFPNGDIEYYDKKHLFTLAGEDKFFSSGIVRKVITYKGWKIMPLVCYDLRFPVWSRNDLDYDLVLYTANWPERRIYAWNTLLKARAIENMSYVVGTNRVGTDGNNIIYSGESTIINPMGEEILGLPKYTEDIKNMTLNKEEQNNIRKKLSFLDDQDSFKIKTNN